MFIEFSPLILYHNNEVLSRLICFLCFNLFKIFRGMFFSVYYSYNAKNKLV